MHLDLTLAGESPVSVELIDVSGRTRHRELLAGLAVGALVQLVPGVTWQWHPQWSSHARMYVTHDAPKGGKVNTSLAGLISTTWQFTPLSSASLSYAIGEENASQLIKGLIGEKNFQSVGVDLKYGFNERLSLQPTYRYEMHNLFDLHAIGRGLVFRGDRLVVGRLSLLAEEAGQPGALLFGDVGAVQPDEP